MNIVSLINQKGGVGKTTTTINLAVSLAKMKKKVLLIDFDSQSNLTMTLTNSNDSQNLPSLYNVFLNKLDINDMIIKTDFLVDLIPSNKNLTDLQTALLGKNHQHNHTFLRDSLHNLKTEYDYIFIDCPPTLNIQVINALITSNKILIPVTPSNYAIQGLSDIIYSINSVKTVNPNIEYFIFMTKYDKRKSISKNMMNALTTALNDKVLHSFIRENVAVEYSQEQKKPLMYYDEHSNATEDYNNMAKEIMTLWEK